MTASNEGLVGIVGPCAAGKSTLNNSLRLFGINARHIAQEHSYVADMWKRITNPGTLIYLHVSFPVTLLRRKLSWTISDYNEQLRRLGHAHENADLIIDTDPLTPEEVLSIVLNFLEKE